MEMQSSVHLVNYPMNSFSRLSAALVCFMFTKSEVHRTSLRNLFKVVEVARITYNIVVLNNMARLETFVYLARSGLELLGLCTLNTEFGTEMSLRCAWNLHDEALLP